ncbi:hypothetical protein SARC_07025 [Sphaeroforma arctica JP610]|uniref:Uncharacterized protein n=1 Tax=Sphaeroforma arctica JP610 TaxID=667725 RepID=A0A0L0FUU9_9EUKA|nr:hypothetical protein SARC_07025 [Sphaeroforma arctica JP610]KNC80615.1 hypothetical protein SARC_07025 [Sphaeroforma arctica JP610]|eukprot:XP_014154517.1 hypothetical protein SARC_07025 [Sphaeroforma arctica JP610]
MAYRAPPKVISKAMKLAETPRYLKQKAKGSKLVNDKVLKNNMLQQKKEPQQLYMPSIFMKLVRPGPTANGVPRPKNVALVGQNS